MSKLARCRIRNLWDLFGPCVARLHWFAIRDAKIFEGKFAGQTKFTRREQIEDGVDI